jgi:iron complex transport system ATP-binding protein
VTLVAQSLTVRLGSIVAVRDVNIACEAGRVTAILGPNGAGKTSLLRALAGLVPVESGNVILEECSIITMPARERARKIGYLPQNGVPAWNVSARELVGLGRLPHRAAYAGLTAADRHAVDQALAATDTLHLADRTMDAMSGGERARVKMARVLAGRPQWILADEPLANLDPPHQRDLLALMRTAAQSGQGVVIVLHQLGAAARVADDIVLMKAGEIIAQGDCEAVLTPDNLERTFDMRFEIIDHKGKIAIVPQS